MAEETRPDIKLEGSTATWDIRLEGNINGTYLGTFRFRCYLTPMQQIAAGREERDLLGPNLSLATEHERFLAYALSQLKYRIISAPPFWATDNAMPGDLADEEVVAAVMDAAVHAEIKYKESLKSRKEQAINRAKQMAELIEADKNSIPTNDVPEDEE